jgi:hypothetical protein
VYSAQVHAFDRLRGRLMSSYRKNVSYQRAPRCADRFAVGVFLVTSELARASACEVLRVHSDGADQEDKTAVMVQPVRHCGAKRESWLFTRQGTGLLLATPFQVVDLTDRADQDKGIKWWRS